MQIPGQLVFSLASQLVLAAMALTAVWQAGSGALDVPRAVALIVVIVRYLEAFTVLAELSGGLESAVGALRRIGRVLTAPTVPAGDRSWASTNAVGIELRDVDFAYGDHSVLSGFTLSLEPGTTTAICGVPTALPL